MERVEPDTRHADSNFCPARPAAATAFRTEIFSAQILGKSVFNVRQKIILEKMCNLRAATGNRLFKRREIGKRLQYTAIRSSFGAGENFLLLG